MTIKFPVCGAAFCTVGTKVAEAFCDRACECRSCGASLQVRRMPTELLVGVFSQLFLLPLWLVLVPEYALALLSLAVLMTALMVGLAALPLRPRPGASWLDLQAHD